MTWKETGNKILDKIHTKKRWPYAVMIVAWLVFTIWAGLILTLAYVGMATVELHMAPQGEECVQSLEYDGMMCQGPDCSIEYDDDGAMCSGKDCSFGNNATLGIDTNGDYNVDKLVVVDSDAYNNDLYERNRTYPLTCPLRPWFMSFVIFVFRSTEMVLIALTAAVWTLVAARLVVWVRG